MSQELLQKLPFVLKILFIFGTLTTLTYHITISTSKIAPVTEAYVDAILYSEATSPFTLTNKEIVRRPFEPVKPRDPRAIKLERFLHIQQSDLADHADLIVDLSDRYGIDYKMIVAIAGAESGYCNKVSFDNNCWGYGTFSWPTIEAGVKGYLSKMNVGYFSQGRKTIETIAPIYNTANTQEFVEKVEHHYMLIP